MTQPPFKSTPHNNFITVPAICYLSICFYVFMEWIFFVTKPSFLDALSVGQKILVYLQTEWTIFLVIIPLIFLLSVLSLLPYTWAKSGAKVILLLITAFFLSITFLLIVDNFTYTILKYGIIRSRGVWRGAYLCLIAVLFFLMYQQSIRLASNPHKQKTIRMSAFILFALSTTAVITGFFTRTESARMVNTRNLTRTPNIILVGTDALDASHLPFYGYERDTTPFLTTIVEDALVMENHFSNANNSAGSVGSIFTGKLPTRTRVSKYPDTYQGKDAYEHFPGILMDSGYLNYEITYSTYEDALKLNIKSGFHRASGVALESSIFSRYISQYLPDPARFLLDSLIERVSDRLLHISYIRIMPDPFTQVFEDNNIEDRQERIPELMKVISESKQPYFVHMHLLGTHGPRYDPSSKFFSGETDQTGEWMADFYDDAIRDFDGYLKDMFSTLTKNGQLENTIVILYTDHPRSRETIHRIPLVIWFPSGEYRGRLTSNTSNLDIGPTILDYLGLSKPKWMEGVSLIQGDLDPYRPIFGTIWHKPKTPGGTPPYNEFGNFRVTICQKYVDYDPPANKWSGGIILKHTAPCPMEKLPSVHEMQDILIRRINKDGYDTTPMEQSREGLYSPLISSRE